MQPHHRDPSMPFPERAMFNSIFQKVWFLHEPQCDVLSGRHMGRDKIWCRTVWIRRSIMVRGMEAQQETLREQSNVSIEDHQPKGLTISWHLERKQRGQVRVAESPMCPAEDEPISARHAGTLPPWEIRLVCELDFTARLKTTTTGVVGARYLQSMSISSQWLW